MDKACSGIPDLGLCCGSAEAEANGAVGAIRPETKRFDDMRRFYPGSTASCAGRESQVREGENETLRLYPTNVQIEIVRQPLLGMAVQFDFP